MSEHTKGELTVEHGGLWAGPDGMLCVADCIDGDFDANAARLALCWNQHDALTAKALLVDELVAALTKAREDICWMLNQRKFLNADCFDYLHVVLAKHTRPT